MSLILDYGGGSTPPTNDILFAATNDRQQQQQEASHQDGYSMKPLHSGDSQLHFEDNIVRVFPPRGVSSSDSPLYHPGSPIPPRGASSSASPLYEGGRVDDDPLYQGGMVDDTPLYREGRVDDDPLSVSTFSRARDGSPYTIGLNCHSGRSSGIGGSCGGDGSNDSCLSTPIFHESSSASLSYSGRQLVLPPPIDNESSTSSYPRYSTTDDGAEDAVDVSSASISRRIAGKATRRRKRSPPTSTKFDINDNSLHSVYAFIKSFLSASSVSTVAIDNKIEQAMDLVKSHLMFAVREEVDVLKERIGELMERINHLEYENTILRKYATQEAIQQLQHHAPNP